MQNPSNSPKKRGRPSKSEQSSLNLESPSAPAPANTPPPAQAPSGAMLGFEAKLWLSADKLRNNMDAAEYKHVVLGLVFLKYISDAFEEKYAALVADKEAGADPEDPDE